MDQNIKYFCYFSCLITFFFQQICYISIIIGSKNEKCCKAKSIRKWPYDDKNYNNPGPGRTIQNCIFPFIIGGIKYNGCVCNSGSCKSGRKSNGDETCAIEVDSDGKATKMGVCNMSICIKCDKGK